MAAQEAGVVEAVEAVEQGAVPAAEVVEVVDRFVPGEMVASP